MFAVLRRLTLALVLIPSLCALPALAAAQDLPQPRGAIVLTVSGDIAVTNSGNMAVFDMEMLMDLPAASFETTTTWTDGIQTFQGVSLMTLMDLIGAEAGTIKATAINDYAVDIPVSDAVEGGPILAYTLNGDPMSVRDKGPLWVVYPYDSSADYRSEVIYARSIWQLDRLAISQ